MPVVVDAADQVLGRLSSLVARRLMRGEDIILVNAQKALITGRRAQILEEYHHRRDRGSERRGPYYPRTPANIVRRTIRGMLPYQQAKGREALKRLRVFPDVPKEYAGVAMVRFKEASEVTTPRVMTVAQISSSLGSRGVVK